MSRNPYTLIEFLDHILKIDASGEFIPKRDDNGNVIINKITGRPELVAEQEGTRLNARNMNHLDLWLSKAHEHLAIIEDWRLKKDIRDEIDDKSPGNAGSFADSFDDDPTRIKRETAVADITSAVTAGTTVLPVDSVTGFVAFTEVTVYDGTNTEDVLITAIGDGTITVQALAHDYVKGARIARSNAKIADGQMGNGSWGTYSVSMMGVV